MFATKPPNNRRNYRSTTTESNTEPSPKKRSKFFNFNLFSITTLYYSF